MARTKGSSNRPYPPLSLEKAFGVAQAIVEHNAGKPMNRLLLAEAMGHKPGSSTFRDRITSSGKYGLTGGSYQAENITLTSLGERAARPRNEQERIEALREAMQEVDIYDELLSHFANNKLPKPGFLKNTLEREPFNVDPRWSSLVAEAFTEDARFVGYLRDIGGSDHIVIDGSTAVPEPPPIETASEGLNGASPQAEASATNAHRTEATADPPPSLTDQPVPMQIFIAHGKNRKPLEQLKGILNEWKVPYLVAVDEPNAGRPISEKVAQTMRACTAGIFVFTADEDFLDTNNNEVSRPSENVVYELGAASLLYGRKIVILKEHGVSFPSDFSDLGWIEFEGDDIRPVAMDLLKEMIALDAVRLVSAASR